ncbi:MAG: transglutaminase-like domain-containing protein [Planctomycetota bacterium]
MRLATTDPVPSLRVELACLISLCAVATLGLLSAQLVAIGVSASSLDTAVVSILVNALFLLPMIRRTVERRTRVTQVLDELTWAILNHAMSAGLVIALLSASPVAALAGLLVLVHGYLLADAHLDGSAALSLGVGLVEVVLSLEVGEGIAPLILLPLQLVAVTVAASKIQPRSDRRRIQSHSRAAREESATKAALESRGRYGVLVGALVCLVTLFVFPWLPHPSWIGWESLLDRAPSRNVVASAGADGSAARPKAFPESLSLGEDLDPLGGEVILELRLLTMDGRPLEERPDSVLLRGMVQDRFLGDSLELSDFGDREPRSDDDDGQRDGWVRLQRGFANRVAAIEQRPMFIEGTDRFPIFLIEPTLAIEDHLDLTFHEEGVVLGRSSASRVRYQITWQERELSMSSLEQHRARHRSARYYQLPSSERLLRPLRTEAARITQGARSDVERVVLLTEHFRSRFQYSLSGSGIDGIEGVLRFLEDRRGYCKHFAAASVLLLRTLGVPCRVAYGFRATEWSNETESYVVRSKDGHAWFEVYFEGVGWVPFDSTAPDRIEAEVAAQRRRAPEEGATWGERLGKELSLWSEDTDSRRSLSRIARVLFETPELIGARAIRYWTVLVALIGIGLGLRFIRAPALRWKRHLPWLATEELLASSDIDRLRRALARRGVPCSSSATLIEIAARVDRDRSESLSDLPRVARELYRARFGGLPLSSEEKERFEALLKELARSSAETRPERWNGERV